ncbi:hydantoinase/oxoprolinase family protein [Streptosporangium sp. NPDC004631]
MTTARYALAIDVGGTFVDVTLCNLADGRRRVDKVLESEGPLEGFVSAVRRILAMAEVPAAEVCRVVHGTTLSTNTILEQSSGLTAVVTTEGFQDVLEIGRHDAPREGDINRWLKPRRPVRRHQILTVRERVSYDGTVVTPLDEAELDRLVEGVRALAPESVAIVLINGYAAHEHERRVRDRLSAEFPELHLSVSHEVLPQIGEYERTFATVLNAYVQPRITTYLSALRRELDALGVEAPLYVMSSDGGILSAAEAADFPINTVLSGPAAGAAGATAYACDLGFTEVVTLDVGGTSSDLACAEGGRVDVTAHGEIGPFPIGVPVLAIHTTGAGGGSIAEHAHDRFTVGPRSAGAQPGPACYGGGGTRATVTDALLTLGWLPQRIAGGVVELDAGAAERALRDTLARTLGGTAVDAASGVVRIANSHMANAIRQVSTEAGRDPRDYTLVAFGGAGGLHAVPVAQQAQLARVVIPPHSGVFTTEGLLAADLTRFFVHSFPSLPRLGGIDLDELARVFDELERRGHKWLDNDPLVESRSLTRLLDLRYLNQSFELRVRVPSGPLTPEVLGQAVEDFHTSHTERYSYAMRDVEVQLVHARLAVSGVLPHPPRGRIAGRAEGDAALPGRDVHFHETGWVPARIFDRERLAGGQSVAGPAVIQDYDSTITLPPGSTAQVLDDGGLLVDLTTNAGGGSR